jgi:beta-galactosidase
MTKYLSATALLFGVLLLLGTARQSRANDGIFPPAPAAKSAIDFDGRGFLIHGKRTPILSAGMEYARVPRALWRDRLLRLKRAGFNCVEMYTFWNFHEPKEGQFDFKGDHDLDAFLKLIHQMGMYAICRVGPYYCAEWDGGGYPVWLRFKPGVHVRTDDPKFLAAMDPFFDKLLPIVAANQVNHGGAVVLVQLENEHLAGGGNEIPNAYFKHLQTKALALGIEVPYFFSGLHHGGDPAGDHSWDSVGRKNPWMTTEFWSVNFDRYGAGPTDADTYERRTWKIFAFGGNGYNDYMAHGGTNFGYTNNDEDAASYDYGSAVGQAGDLRPTYYRYKRINSFALTFADIVENSVNADAEFQGVATDSTIRITARRSPGGNIVFLDNSGKSTVKTYVKGPDGQSFPASGPMTLPPGQIVPIVEGASLTPHITLALGATRILGTTTQGGTTTLVVYGLPGDPGQLRLTAPADAQTQGAAGAWTQAPSGQYDLTLSYPADRPKEYRLTAGDESVKVLAMSDTLADHTWFIPIGVQTAIVCGPAYVGDVISTGDNLRLTTERGQAAPQGITPDPYAEASPALVYGLGIDGTALTAQTSPAVSATAPRLSAWETQAITEAAPKYADARWLTSENPQPMGADSDASAYAWYRTTLHASSAGDYTLAFQSANDRMIAFLDGVHVPNSAPHQNKITLSLTPGNHSVAILAVHYGRAKLFGYTGPLDTIDVKGLVGPARLGTSAGPGVALTDWRVVMVTNGDHLAPPAADAPGWAAVKVGDDPFHGNKGVAWFQTTLPASLIKSGPGRQVLHFESVDDNGTVFLNGKQVAHHEGWNEAFDAPLSAALADGQPVVLSVLVQNLDNAGGLDKPVTLFSYRSDAPVIGWKMRGGIEQGLSETAWKPLPAGPGLDGSPRYFRTHFTDSPPDASGPHPILRVVTSSLSAGFVWLNGHNLGRYPEKIPVNGLYLPECWLQRGDNTLVIFDEDGKRPSAAALTVETVASRTLTDMTTK